MLFDYETLRVIWWVLLGVLLMGFAVMDGFDFGVAMLLRIVGKSDGERRVVINTVGPVWEGNQVWFVLGGGAIFAAWPILYAVSFSGFYLAMLLLLFGFILRPVSFKYRSKVSSTRWRNTWDIMMSISGYLPALLFGVAVGNVIQGVPFHFDETVRAFYTGNLFGLLNPFGLLCGLLSLFMMMMHGGLYLNVKTEGDVQRRSRTAARVAGIIVIILFAIGGYWVANGMDGYVLVKPMLHGGPSNPLHKTAAAEFGAWMDNYHRYQGLLAVPALGFIGALLAILLAGFERGRVALVCSAFSIAGIIGTVGVSMFPFILPSSTNPSMSLMVWDASSSQLTLFVMLVAAVIFLPLILFYTGWVYHVMRGKVTELLIAQNTKDAY